MNEQIETPQETKPVNKKELVYKLKHPIQWDNGKGSELITEVKFMKPKGKHVKMLKNDAGMAELLMMASKLSLVSHKFFDELDSEDAFGVANYVGELL